MVLPKLNQNFGVPFDALVKLFVGVGSLVNGDVMADDLTRLRRAR
jgi:hypothetical protein